MQGHVVALRLRRDLARIIHALLLQSRIRCCDEPSVGRLTARSLDVLFKYASRLRMPVSQHDCAVSRRTVMNNAGLVCRFLTAAQRRE